MHEAGRAHVLSILQRANRSGPGFLPELWGNVPLIHKGDKDMQVTVDILNLSDQECTWKDGSFTGLSVYASSGASFKSAVGVEVGLSFEQALGLIGTNSASYQSEFKRSAEVNVYVGSENDNAMGDLFSTSPSPMLTRSTA